MKVKTTFAVLALAALALALPIPAAADRSPVVEVEEGESIQAAIDAASPGTTIEIEEGTYKESLVIKKDGIRLVGDGRKETHIVPPDNPVPGEGCVSEQTVENPPNPPTTVVVADGICVGDLDTQSFPPPAFKDVHISKLSVKGFNVGIFLFGAEDSVVKRVIASDNDEYGIFAIFSTGTHISRNVTANDGEAGIYVGDSPNADATIWKNVAYGSTFGIFIRDAANGKVLRNKAFDNCLGILFLNTEESPPDEPLDVADWLAARNKVTDNNRACPAGEAPPLSGLGIAVLGGVNIDLIGNGVFGNKTPPNTESAFSGGILVMASPFFATPKASTQTTVAHNKVLGNDPDLFWDGIGDGNTFVDNVCATSVPDGLCDRSGNGGNGKDDDGNGDDGDGNHGNGGQGHDDDDGDDDHGKGNGKQHAKDDDDDDHKGSKGQDGRRSNGKQHSSKQDRDDDD